jgi:hypothetical protein
MLKNIAIIVTGGVLLYLSGCNYNKVDYLKSKAKETWETNGFKIIGYSGYQIGTPFETPGGRVWHIVERNGVTYEGFISAWGDEIHTYKLKAKDAIAPQ